MSIKNKIENEIEKEYWNKGHMSVESVTVHIDVNE